MSRRAEPFLLAGILLIAGLLRFAALDAIPPGLTHDEAAVGFYAAAVARGEPAGYDVPYGYAYEPYGQYSAGLLMRFLGATGYTLRVHQTLYGLLVVGFTYAWARRTFGWKVAASASLLVATLFWTVFTSRMALNSQPVPAVFLLAAIALWRGLYPPPPPAGEDPAQARDTNLLWWGVFGLSVAAMLHIYEAARAVWFTLPAFGVYLLLTDRARLRKHGLKFGLALGIGTVLALPHLLDPGVWGRTEALGGALTALASGDPGPLFANAIEGLGTLTFGGDTLITYNVPGRAILGPLEGVFFYIGLLYCLMNLWRRPACAFLLLWLAFGLAPTLVTGAWTSTLHSIAAQPVVCILPAVGAMGLVRWMRGRGWVQEAAVLTGIWIIILAQVGLRTAYDYFVQWGQHPEVRAVYFHTLTDITGRIDNEMRGTVALSTPFPEPPLDPFIGLMRIDNPAVDVRWMDGRYAVILPPVEDARFIASADAPLDPTLAELLPFQHVERVELRPDDFNPYYDIYRFDSETARAYLDQALPNLTIPANFGGAVELQGCRVEVAEQVVTVVTRWQVLDMGALGEPPPTQYAHELKIFVHALDADGEIIGQADVLGAPSSDWRADDVFVHIHRIDLAAMPPVDMRLLAGVYNRVSKVRLPLVRQGEPAGDSVLLQCYSPNL